MDNQKREKEAEDNLIRVKRENKEKVEALKLENEMTLATMMEENERQEALMVAKHEGEEKAIKKAAELEAERSGEEERRPQIPACPVRSISLPTLGHINHILFCLSFDPLICTV